MANDSTTTPTKYYIVRDTILNSDNEEIGVRCHETVTEAVHTKDGGTLDTALDTLAAADMYTSATPVTADIGGIKKGSTISDASIKDIIDDLLHPEVPVSYTISGAELVNKVYPEDDGGTDEIDFIVTVDPGTHGMVFTEVYKGDQIHTAGTTDTELLVSETMPTDADILTYKVITWQDATKTTKLAEISIVYERPADDDYLSVELEQDVSDWDIANMDTNATAIEQYIDAKVSSEVTTQATTIAEQATDGLSSELREGYLNGYAVIGETETDNTGDNMETGGVTDSSPSEG